MWPHFWVFFHLHTSRHFCKNKTSSFFSVTKMAISNYRKSWCLLADDVRNNLGWDISSNLMFYFIETAFVPHNLVLYIEISVSLLFYNMNITILVTLKIGGCLVPKKVSWSVYMNKNAQKWGHLSYLQQYMSQPSLFPTLKVVHTSPLLQKLTLLFW